MRIISLVGETLSVESGIMFTGQTTKSMEVEEKHMDIEINFEEGEIKSEEILIFFKVIVTWY